MQTKTETDPTCARKCQLTYLFGGMPTILITDICRVTLLPFRRLFWLAIDLLSLAAIGVCAPFAGNNKSAQEFSGEASPSKHSKSLKEGRTAGGFDHLEVRCCCEFLW